MSLLYDAMMRGEVFIGANKDVRQTVLAMLAERMPSAVVVEASNVETFTRESDNTWMFAEDGAPASRPPWDNCWIEWRQVNADDVRGRFGALVITVKIDEEWRAAVSERAPGAPEAVWSATAYWMGLDDGDRFPSYIGYTGVLFDADGHPLTTRLDDGDLGLYFVCEPSEGLGEADAAAFEQYLRQSQRVALTAFAFAHMKNVAMVDEAQTYPSRQARRAAERRGDPPLTKYKTLRIGPVGTRRVEGGPGGIRHRMLPLHIVRGHFQTYSPDRPMFGKHAGTFWVPAHVRGNQGVGIVAKDYTIEPGSTVAAVKDPRGATVDKPRGTR